MAFNVNAFFSFKLSYKSSVVQKENPYSSVSSVSEKGHFNLKGPVQITTTPISAPYIPFLFLLREHFDFE